MPCQINFHPSPLSEVVNLQNRYNNANSLHVIAMCFRVHSIDLSAIHLLSSFTVQIVTGTPRMDQDYRGHFSAAGISPLYNPSINFQKQEGNQDPEFFFVYSQLLEKQDLCLYLTYETIFASKTMSLHNLSFNVFSVSSFSVCPSSRWHTCHCLVRGLNRSRKGSHKYTFVVKQIINSFGSCSDILTLNFQLVVQESGLRKPLSLFPQRIICISKSL